MCGCFSACSFGFAKDEQVIGKYHIIAVDVAEDVSLAYEVGDGNYVGIVPAEVVAYAKSKDYIFVQQNPYGQKDTTINYYIVPILQDTVTVYPEERIIGPLTVQQFDKKVLDSGVKKLEFKEID